MCVSSVELHQKLGQTIDRARLEPVVITKHDRDHVVIMSAEEYTRLLQSVRQSRRTGSLSAAERAAVAAATVPSEAEQQRFLDELAASVDGMLLGRPS